MDPFPRKCCKFPELKAPKNAAKKKPRVYSKKGSRVIDTTGRQPEFCAVKSASDKKINAIAQLQEQKKTEAGSK